MLSRVGFSLKKRALERRAFSTTPKCRAGGSKPTITYAKNLTLTSSVEVKFDDQKFHLDAFWLRDNCPGHVHDRTFQRLSPTALIPLDVKPLTVNVEDGKLLIDWPDKHSSVYTSEWLWNHLHREKKDIEAPNSHNTVLWSGKTWSSADAIPVRVNFEKLLAEKDNAPMERPALKSLLENLYVYGFAMVDDTPATLEATRAVGESIGILRGTIFGGDSWDYVVESQAKDDLLHSDTAYTPMDIKPHTDGTYHHDPVGIQLFHCLEHQGTGGVNGIIDGWNVLTKIKDQHPDAFAFLTSEPIDFYYSDSKYAFHSLSPVATVNQAGALTSFRFNNHDRNPPHPLRKDLSLYHKSIQLLQRELENPENSVDIKLLPGTVLLTYGWRTLHSRTPFTGRRRMAGAYVGKDDFLSKYRVVSRDSSSDLQLH